MKLRNLLLFAICISIKLSAQVNYKISSEIQAGFSEFNVYVLQSEGRTKQLPISNGKLDYEGTVEEPEILLLIISFSAGENMRLPVFITGGEVELVIKEDNTVEINGNTDAKDFYHQLAQPVQQWNVKVGELDDKLAIALKKKIADTATIRKESEKAVDGCFQVLQDFIKANPKSLVSIQALYYMDKGKDVGKPITVKDLERMYQSLDESVRNHPLGKKYQDDLSKWKGK